MIPRYISAVLLASFVTFGLFFLMQFLISQSSELGEKKKGRVIEFVRLKKDSDLELKKRQKPDKKPPPEPPPPPDLQMAKADKPKAGMNTISIPSADVEANLSTGFQLAQADADVVPLVRVEPQYPPRAASRGLEGWVALEFTISALGTVKNASVIDSSNAVFNRAALKAIKKWKYKPRIEDGNAVERTGVQVKLTFQLDN